MSNREIYLKLSPDYSILKWQYNADVRFSFKKREIEI